MCQNVILMTNKHVYTVTSLLLHIRIILLINHIRPIVSCKVYILLYLYDIRILVRIYIILLYYTFQ